MSAPKWHPTRMLLAQGITTLLSQHGCGAAKPLHGAVLRLPPDLTGPWSCPLAAGQRPGRPRMLLCGEIQQFSPFPQHGPAQAQAPVAASRPALQWGPWAAGAVAGAPLELSWNCTGAWWMCKATPHPPVGMSPRPQSLATAGHLPATHLTRVFHKGPKGAKEPQHPMAVPPSLC